MDGCQMCTEKVSAVRNGWTKGGPNENNVKKVKVMQNKGNYKRSLTASIIDYAELLATCG